MSENEAVTQDDHEAARAFFSNWPRVAIPSYLPAALAEEFARHRRALQSERDALAERVRVLEENLACAEDRGRILGLMDAEKECKRVGSTTTFSAEVGEDARRMYVNGTEACAAMLSEIAKPIWRKYPLEWIDTFPDLALSSVPGERRQA